ncbi:demethoxyubiquinone hydroxylase family protein [Altererythrobacter xixiisoli]|uniref:Demethoxyubiquinone hydroxylase family protein n=1 Tax=Croceibacterium xixiisoli TaxID=1476466 RepID=A0A6I4TQJ3_9SPHN|nr:demethoxyubiquinone hydroxylase family protein [Croceibacterium xixiisoli]MXO97420.1 demethoxyubiquinone hydroxylase family protein [Croceibacterium xixiisoli]
MALTGSLSRGETLGDRIMKVDHAGEHGAVCIYRTQRWLARWRAPQMVAELDHFIAHERSHRALFGAELSRRGCSRCRSYLLCGLGGFTLGFATGLAGQRAIAATTVAIERVVLRHMQEQVAVLQGIDQPATDLLRLILIDEQEHHDLSASRISQSSLSTRLIDAIVTASTEAVIWLGMRL